MDSLESMHRREVAASTWWAKLTGRERNAYLRAHPRSRMGSAPGPADPLHEHAAYHLREAQGAARSARGSTGHEQRHHRAREKEHRLAHRHYAAAQSRHEQMMFEAAIGGRHARRALRLEDF